MRGAVVVSYAKALHTKQSWLCQKNMTNGSVIPSSQLRQFNKSWGIFVWDLNKEKLINDHSQTAAIYMKRDRQIEQDPYAANVQGGGREAGTRKGPFSH